MGLIVNGAIQIAGVALGQDILVNEGIVNNIVGYTALGLTVALVGYQFYVAWKNNSFTKEAKIADLQLKAMREGITEIEVETVSLSPEVQELSSKEVK